MGETPRRSFRISDELYSKMEEAAAKWAAGLRLPARGALARWSVAVLAEAAERELGRKAQGSDDITPPSGI
jgi:hypothetical protein